MQLQALGLATTHWGRPQPPLLCSYPSLCSLLSSFLPECLVHIILENHSSTYASPHLSTTTLHGMSVRQALALVHVLRVCTLAVWGGAIWGSYCAKLHVESIWVWTIVCTWRKSRDSCWDTPLAAILWARRTFKLKHSSCASSNVNHEGGLY